MLRNLSQYLTRTEGPRERTDAVADCHDAFGTAFRARAEADAALRQAEADLRGISNQDPALEKGEIWALRPKAWAEAAPIPCVVGPSSGDKIAPGLTVFHDCPLKEFSLRQHLQGEPSPFYLEIDVLRFEGGFLSLCVEIDLHSCVDLHKNDVMRVRLDAELESPVTVYARLNLKQGPNEYQNIAQLTFGDRSSGQTSGAFDLGYIDLSPDPVDAAWIDLIFEAPSMNSIRLDDVRLSRCKRAGL